MFAIIKTGGKQYLIEKNKVIKVEKILGNVGDTVQTNNPLSSSGGNDIALLMLSDNNGIAFDKGRVELKILEQKRDEKICVFKKKRRKNYRRKRGHRQDITILRVMEISA